MSKDTSGQQGADGRKAAAVAQGDVVGRGVDDKVSAHRGVLVDGANPETHARPAISNNEDIPQAPQGVDPASPASSGIVRDFIPEDSAPTQLEQERLRFAFSTPRTTVQPDFVPGPGDEPVHVPTFDEAQADAQRASDERSKRATADRADEIAGQLGSLNEADSVMVVKDMGQRDRSLALIVEAEGRNRKDVLSLGEPDQAVVNDLDASREARGDYEGQDHEPADDAEPPADVPAFADDGSTREMSVDESQATVDEVSQPQTTAAESAFENEGGKPKDEG